MALSPQGQSRAAVQLLPVDAQNWRAVTRLQVSPPQMQFVATPAYYLALCSYGGTWHPLAIVVGEAVVGFCMWGVDEADDSCWLGGLIVDQSQQGRGYGKAAVRTALDMLKESFDHRNFALSYRPGNSVAKGIHQSLGFIETGEMEDDEVVARLRYP